MRELLGRYLYEEVMCYLKFKCNWASYNLSGSPKVIFRNEREREESVRLNVMELQVVFAF